MNVGDIFQVQNAWSVEGIDSNKKTYAKAEEEATVSGDTVSISDEARELYSKMIHKYDHSGSSDGGDEEGSAPSGGQALGGGDSSSGSSDKVNELKEKIQSLKSQIMSLTAQALKGAPGNAAQSQISALEAQVAALEAELNAMAEA